MPRVDLDRSALSDACSMGPPRRAKSSGRSAGAVLWCRPPVAAARFGSRRSGEDFDSWVRDPIIRPVGRGLGRLVLAWLLSAAVAGLAILPTEHVHHSPEPDHPAVIHRHLA